MPSNNGLYAKMSRDHINKHKNFKDALTPNLSWFPNLFYYDYNFQGDKL